MSACMITQRDFLRTRWHEVRTARLELKKKLMDENIPVSEVRHNPEYRRLKKEQKHISKMIKHMEYKITRGLKNEA
ncbi:MAG: hypothetical protein CVV49_17890 [Spirochaetae bacterium HGW-Spirochaetae-5]|nr:MAG: hypothetical protein CVV49_17890 [Spirochaetae bacterium HGW-Spirochaetae-5]